MADPDIEDIERRMDSAIEVLRREFSGLRAGRASVSLLEPVTVDAYDSQMPLKQLSTISVPESRMLSVQVWDSSLIREVDKAIRNAKLGLNPIIEGALLRIPIPELNEERRLELTRIAGKYSEQAKISIRNVRRDGMDIIKKMERSGQLSQDEQHLWEEEIQQKTDRHIQKIDAMLSAKKEDIIQV